MEEELKFVLSSKRTRVCNDDGVCVDVNDILMANDGNDYLYQFDLPEDIEKRLKYFLENKSTLDGEIIIDCNSFVSYLHGLPLNDRTAITKFDKIKKTEIVAGDVVLIQNRAKIGKHGAFHFAMYMGKGKYISKLSTGPVSISSFEDLMELYEGTNVEYLRKP